MKHTWLVVLVGCAHNVPQDAQTGHDGRQKGAVPIVLDHGEGTSRGVVTYPGGDRVDWRSIELPAGKRGTLELEMTYQTPRPGLKVAFDVFDQYSAPVAPTGPIAPHGPIFERAVAKRSRSAKIDHAAGTYFVRVFAPRRGDAGTYKLAASFVEDPAPIPVSLDVSEPPRLPAVPAPVEECVIFDPHNPSCRSACTPDAPRGWHGCDHTCRTPDANDPSCVHAMACPTPPDRRVDACIANVKKYFAACNQAAPDPANPRCDAADPVSARIIKIEQQGDDVEITIAAGSLVHVEKGWHVQVLQGTSDTPVVGGSAIITHVEKTKATARLHLGREIVEANQTLRLTPP